MSGGAAFGSIASGMFNLLGAKMSGDAQKDAADIAAAGALDVAKESNAAQMKMYNQTRSDFLPYMGGGVQAFGNLIGADWVPTTTYGDPIEMSPQERYHRMTSMLPDLPSGYTYSQNPMDVEKGYVYKTVKGQPEYKDQRTGEVIHEGTPDTQIKVNMSELPQEIQQGVSQVIQNPDWSKKQGPETTTYGWQQRAGGPKDYWADPRNALKEYRSLDTSAGMPRADYFVDSKGNRIMPELPDGVSQNFDPNDPFSKYVLDNTAKYANKHNMATGKYDSRAGTNALSDAIMRASVGERDKQYVKNVDEYNRKYGKGMDIYNVLYNQEGDLDNRRFRNSNTLWDRNQAKQFNLFNAENTLADRAYGKDLDVTKIGTGASGSAGSAATSTGQGIANSFQNAGNAAYNANMAKGNVQGMFYSGLGNWAGDTVNSLYDYYNKPNQYNTQSTYKPHRSDGLH